MSSLKQTKHLLEQALQGEDGKNAMKGGGAKLHCREQLLVAYIMASTWKSKTREEWQSVIDQTNSDHPEWSPLVDSTHASSYGVLEDEGKLAVSWKGKALIAAEDQLASLLKGKGPTKVHHLVEIAHAISLRENAASSTFAVAVAVPAGGGGGDGVGTAELQAKNVHLKEENQELRQQLEAAKDANLEDFRKVFGPGTVSGAVGLEVVKLKAAEKKGAGTSFVVLRCFLLSYYTLLHYESTSSSLTMYACLVDR